MFEAWCAEGAHILRRAPLKKGDMPKLVAKALTILEAAGSLEDLDILPESVRQEQNLMPWLQVGHLGFFDRFSSSRRKGAINISQYRVAGQK
jgi:hypothetical protein